MAKKTKLKSWPFGTVKTGVVIDGPFENRKFGWTVVIESEGEGFILTGVDATVAESLSVDDACKIEFNKGGPAGGFWEVVA